MLSTDDDDCKTLRQFSKLNFIQKKKKFSIDQHENVNERKSLVLIQILVHHILKGKKYKKFFYSIFFSKKKVCLKKAFPCIMYVHDWVVGWLLLFINYSSPFLVPYICCFILFTYTVCLLFVWVVKIIYIYMTYCDWDKLYFMWWTKFVSC